MPVICASLQGQNIEHAKQTYLHLNGLKLADETCEQQDAEIDLLIGSDQMWQFFSGQKISGKSGVGLVAFETSLGWVLSGPVEGKYDPKLSSATNFVETHVLFTCRENSEEMTLTEQVSHLWDIESIGIRDVQDVHKSFIENVSFQNGRYSVSLPFKEYAQDIPDNYNLSLVRLNSLVKRSHKEPEVLEQYDKYVQEQIDSGIVEIVDTKQEPELGQVHYLPHHGVIRKTALTTKLRSVWCLMPPQRLIPRCHHLMTVSL